MELKVILGALARRWYFVILAILLTVGATLLVASKVGPTYEAQGAVLIFPPVATVQRAPRLSPGQPIPSTRRRESSSRHRDPRVDLERDLRPVRA